MTDSNSEEWLHLIQQAFNKQYFHKNKEEQYFLFLTEFSRLLAEYGFYGSSINNAIKHAGLSKSAILNATNKEKSFLLVIDVVQQLCEQEIFSHLHNHKDYASQIDRFIYSFSTALKRYPHFFIVGFLGSCFNQEVSLNNKINQFQQSWQDSIEKLAQPFWKDSIIVKKVGKASMRYLLIAMLELQKGFCEGSINTICNTLAIFWKKHTEVLLTIDIPKQF